MLPSDYRPDSPMARADAAIQRKFQNRFQDNQTNAFINRQIAQSPLIKLMDTMNLGGFGAGIEASERKRIGQRIRKQREEDRLRKLAQANGINWDEAGPVVKLAMRNPDADIAGVYELDFDLGDYIGKQITINNVGNNASPDTKYLRSRSSGKVGMTVDAARQKIAERLGVSPDELKNNQSDAFKALRALYKDDPNPRSGALMAEQAAAAGAINPMQKAFLKVNDPVETANEDWWGSVKRAVGTGLDSPVDALKMYFGNDPTEDSAWENVADLAGDLAIWGFATGGIGAARGAAVKGMQGAKALAKSGKLGRYAQAAASKTGQKAVQNSAKKLLAKRVIGASAIEVATEAAPIAKMRQDYQSVYNLDYMDSWGYTMKAMADGVADMAMTMVSDDANLGERVEAATMLGVYAMAGVQYGQLAAGSRKAVLVDQINKDLKLKDLTDAKVDALYEMAKQGQQKVIRQNPEARAHFVAIADHVLGGNPKTQADFNQARIESLGGQTVTEDMGPDTPAITEGNRVTYNPAEDVDTAFENPVTHEGEHLIEQSAGITRDQLIGTFGEDGLEKIGNAARSLIKETNAEAGAGQAQAILDHFSDTSEGNFEVARYLIQQGFENPKKLRQALRRELGKEQGDVAFNLFANEMIAANAPARMSFEQARRAGFAEGERGTAPAADPNYQRGPEPDLFGQAMRGASRSRQADIAGQRADLTEAARVRREQEFEADREARGRIYDYQNLPEVGERNFNPLPLRERIVAIKSNVKDPQSRRRLLAETTYREAVERELEAIRQDNPGMPLAEARELAVKMASVGMPRRTINTRGTQHTDANGLFLNVPKTPSKEELEAVDSLARDLIEKTETPPKKRTMFKNEREYRFALDENFEANQNHNDKMVGGEELWMGRPDPRDDHLRIGTRSSAARTEPTPLDQNTSKHTITPAQLKKTVGDLKKSFNEFSTKNQKTNKVTVHTDAQLPAYLRRLGPENVAKGLRKLIVNNLLKLHDDVKARNPDEYYRVSRWYDGANHFAKTMAKAFDMGVNQAAGILAVLSPQKDWFQNAALAAQVGDIYKSHMNRRLTPEEFEVAKALFIPKSAKPKKKQELVERADAVRGRTLADVYAEAKSANDAYWDARRSGLTDEKVDSAIKGKRTLSLQMLGDLTRMTATTVFENGFHVLAPEGYVTGYKTNRDGSNTGLGWQGSANIAKAMLIAGDGDKFNIDISTGEQHKVRSFYNNIVAPNSPFADATMDTWATVAGVLLPMHGKSPLVAHVFGKRSAGNNNEGIYWLFLDAYREAAALRGIQPRQMQSITWEAIRYLMPDELKKSIQFQKEITEKFNTIKTEEDAARFAEETIADLHRRKGREEEGYVFDWSESSPRGRGIFDIGGRDGTVPDGRAGDTPRRMGGLPADRYRSELGIVLREGHGERLQVSEGGPGRVRDGSPDRRTVGTGGTEPRRTISTRNTGRRGRPKRMAARLGDVIATANREQVPTEPTPVVAGVPDQFSYGSQARQAEMRGVEGVNTRSQTVKTWSQVQQMADAIDGSEVAAGQGSFATVEESVAAARQAVAIRDKLDSIDRQLVEVEQAPKSNENEAARTQLLEQKGRIERGWMQTLNSTGERVSEAARILNARKMFAHTFSGDVDRMVQRTQNRMTRRMTGSEQTRLKATLDKVERARASVERERQLRRERASKALKNVTRITMDDIRKCNLG